MSGGVNIAATANIITIEYLRLFFRNRGVMSPILVKKYVIIGSSNIIPKAISNFIAKEKYCLTDGSAFTDSFANPRKNLNPKGNTTKYPNIAPPTKRIVEERSR